ncbi:MAG: TlpA family protein disulfide reductase [Gemmatimonadaceae bacterium]|jgi:peroxiredoxin
MSRFGRCLVMGWSLAALAGCGAPERAAVAIGAPAPAYAAQTVDGSPIALADRRGTVVLLNIWATWCKPCREEIPALETLFQQYGPTGFEVIGVSIDAPSEAARLRPFVTELGASYPLWHDPDDRVSSTFLALGVPASYLIDRDGVLRWRHMGPVRADDPTLIAALRTALEARP